ncbi:MAG TPA: PEP/pyruvate-binding domain-containing protein [Polyangiaceae bacterium]
MTWLVPLAAIAKKRGADDPKSIGGKASRLAWLVKQGFAVPDAWVLPVDAFAAALRELPPACDPKQLLRAAGGRAAHERAAEAREAILSAPLVRGLAVEIDELWRAEGSKSPWGFAVRSSSTCEDGSLVSMAGLAQSRLAVFGDEAIGRAIREVWASIASGRALGYLAAHGIRDASVAVVIQRMVRAEAAGVMFTKLPGARSRTRERVVNVGVGLGAPVVDGTATPDMLRLDEKGRVIESLVADKTASLVVRDGALVSSEVENRTEPALSDARVRELAEIALRLERAEDIVWDVEFACDAERTWLVQARPATGRGFPEGGDATTVWSAVNVGEALPGVATPMTWSVAGSFSEAGFRNAFATLGCRVPKSARLVGNVHGRFYLNLTEFMRIAAQVPWLDPRSLVELGGGSGAEEVAAQTHDVSHRGFYARLPMTASRLLKQQLRLDEDVRAFETWAERALKLHHALDLAILPDEGLARTVLDAQAMLERTGTVMLTCASSSLGSHVALKTLLARVSPIDADRLAQALTAGIRDLESARPAIGLMRVAVLAQAEPEAREAIDRETTTGLDAIPDGPTRRALVSFLELYGDRAVREPELSTPRWKEDPRPVLTMLRVALRGEARDSHRALEHARTQADAELQRVLDRMNALEQTALRHLITRAQKAARLRERMRGWVTRVLGLIREVLLDGQRRLLRLMPEIQDDERMLAPGRAPSVFFLTVEELVAALRNARTDLIPLLRLRRAEYARDVARPDPPVTFVGAPTDVQAPPVSSEVLRGTPASSGVVEARVRVLRSADMSAFQPGEVLVVRTTDVGWTPLFLMAAGVVTELGGALSHAAIVAREFGVPSVVNVPGVTRLLRTGDRVRLDGDQGTIERLRD